MVGMLVTAQSKCDIRPITIHKGACGTLDVVKSSRKQHVLQLSGKKNYTRTSPKRKQNNYGGLKVFSTKSHLFWLQLLQLFPFVPWLSQCACTDPSLKQQ